MRGAGCGVRGAGCGVRGAGCGVRGAGCGVRGAGCGVRDQQKNPHKCKITTIIKQLKQKEKQKKIAKYTQEYNKKTRDYKNRARIEY